MVPNCRCIHRSQIAAPCARHRRVLLAVAIDRGGGGGPPPRALAVLPPTPDDEARGEAEAEAAAAWRGATETEGGGPLLERWRRGDGQQQRLRAISSRPAQWDRELGGYCLECDAAGGARTPQRTARCAHTTS